MKKYIIPFTILFSLVFFNCKNTPVVELNIMSFNVRYDNPADSLNNWQYRKNVAAQIIKEQNADIVGTQEVLINQLNDLKSRLSDYNTVGVGRTDGKEEGEHCAILYKKTRFNEIKSGNFWLSETPDIAGSKGWDGACERIATWVILEDIKSKKQFFAINTHLDHIGKQARTEGVTLLLKEAKVLSAGLPIIMTGDFNATPDSEVIKHVVESSNPNHLIHTKDIANTKSDQSWTFHDFGRIPVERRTFIDYIFVSPEINVITHSVMPEKLEGVFISDHSAVAALIELK